MHDGVITISLNGKIKSWNKGAERVFGINKQDILGEYISQLFSGKDNMNIQEELIESTLDKDFHAVEFDFHKPNIDEIRYCSLSSSLLKNIKNEITGIVCYCADITNKKIAEDKIKTSQDNFKAIFNGSTEAIFFIDNKFKLIDYNKLAKTYSAEIFNIKLRANKDILETLSFLNKNEYINLFNNTLNGVTHNLNRMFEFDSALKFFKITIYPIIDKDDDVIDRFCISFVDITERKKIEKDLEDSRNELKPLFDSSIQRFYLCDLDYNLVTFNRIAKDIIQKEFKHSLKKGDNILEFVPKEMGQDLFTQYFERAKNGEHIIHKSKHTTSNESYYWSEAHLNPILNYKGELTRVLLWTIDITDREKNNDALRDSEERYSLIAEGSNDGIWDWDLVKDEIYLSPRWKAVLGYNIDEEISRQYVQKHMIHPDDRQRTRIEIKNYLEGKTDVYLNEYRLKHKNGEYKTLLERGIALRDENNIAYRFAGSISDITKQKKIEDEIKSTNSLLLEERNMFIKGNVVVFRVDAITNSVLYVSENVTQVTGYSINDFSSKKIDLTSIIYNEDLPMFTKERNVAFLNDVPNIEFSNYRIKTKDGKLIWIQDFTSLIRDENGNVTQLLGYLIDVSAEQNVAKKLEASQKKYFTVFSEANDAILIIDDFTNLIVEANKKASELFGFTKNELLKLSLLDLSPQMQTSGKTSKEIREKMIRVSIEDKNHTFKWKQKRSDGKLIDVEVSLTHFTHEGKIYRHAIIRDISKRIIIEQSLKKSEEKNRALIKAIPDIIFVIDKNGTYLDFKADINAKFVPDKEVIGLNHRDYFEGEKLEEILSKIKTTIKTGEIQVVEYQLRSPIGMRWFEARLSKLNDEKVLSIVRDVTDKYKMQEKMNKLLAQHEEKIEELTQN